MTVLAPVTIHGLDSNGRMVAVSVDSTGAVSLRAVSSVATGNTTNTPLAANGDYVGDWEDAGGPTIKIKILSSTHGSLEVQTRHSADYTPTSTFYDIPANSVQSILHHSGDAQLRLLFVNLSASAQTGLEIVTYSGAFYDFSAEIETAATAAATLARIDSLIERIETLSDEQRITNFHLAQITNINIKPEDL